MKRVCKVCNTKIPKQRRDADTCSTECQIKADFNALEGETPEDRIIPKNVIDKHAKEQAVECAACPQPGHKCANHKWREPRVCRLTADGKVFPRPGPDELCRCPGFTKDPINGFSAVDKLLFKEWHDNEGSPLKQRSTIDAYERQRPEYAAKSTWLVAAKSATESALSHKVTSNTPIGRRSERRYFVESRLREKGWSINDWASACKPRLAVKTLTGYLNGKRTPYPDTLKRMAVSLGVTAADFPL